MPHSSQVTTIRLHDGSRVAVRPIEPGDRDRLARAFERLSEDSRYRRFFTPLPRLSEAHLAYLTEVDHADHEALLAMEPTSGEAIGVARYVRSQTDPQAAEAAITVADDWRGRGLGGTLLERLVVRARDEDVRRFTALVQADNRRAIRTLEGIGAAQHVSQGSEVELTIELPERPGVGPQLARALREAASGSLIAAGSVARRLPFVGRPQPQPPSSPLRRGRPIRTIVAGTDGSERAERALREAVELAARLDARLHLVSGSGGPPDGRLRELADAVAEGASGTFAALDPRTGAEAALRSAADMAREAELEPSTHLRDEEAADALLAVAEEQDADLIVVGSKGMSGARRFLLGSVPGKVSHHAPCSVLVVRTD